MDPRTILKNSFIHLKIDNNKVKKKRRQTEFRQQLNVSDCQHKPTDCFMTHSSKGKLHGYGNNCILLLGSNLGNRVLNIRRAIDQLERNNIKVIKKSRIYCSDPWGYESSNAFLNQAVEVSTIEEATNILKIIKVIESEMGRVKIDNETYNDRIIDIDIIFFGNQEIKSEQLIVPHPKMQERRFVLQPVCELIPDFIHPVLKKTINQLLMNCKDEGKVSVFLGEQNII